MERGRGQLPSHLILSSPPTPCRGPQIPSNFLKFPQIPSYFPNSPKFPQIASNYLKFPQSSSNFLKFPQFASNSLKLPQIASNYLKFPQIPSNCLKFTQIPSNSLKFPQIPSNSPKFPQIPSNCLKLPKIFSNCLKLKQVIASHSVPQHPTWITSCNHVIVHPFPSPQNQMLNPTTTSMHNSSSTLCTLRLRWSQKIRITLLNIVFFKASHYLTFRGAKSIKPDGPKKARYAAT